jgi:hypothetical protein
MRLRRCDDTLVVEAEVIQAARHVLHFRNVSTARQIERSPRCASDRVSWRRGQRCGVAEMLAQPA